jgi:monovalent cation/proton antiporter MnhG/PhaG subunit
MMALLSALFLVAGAGLCLIAAVGVLRLPDYFMRMHAATKAGVAGCGLLLIGVAFAEPSPGMWIKVAIAIVFLLLTQPIAGHLLARAGYVAGVPLWGGTSDDQLKGELRRGDFDQPATARPRRTKMQKGVDQVVLGLASGRGLETAIAEALELARTHKADLVGLAIVDTKTLHNVGPVPLGGNHYAAQLRNTLTTKARHRMAEAVQSFEQAARAANIRFAVSVEEGDPVAILRAQLDRGVTLVLPRHAWFDHGLAEKQIDPAARLARHRITPAEASDKGDAPIVVFS